jgi:hypothetical protein
MSHTNVEVTMTQTGDVKAVVVPDDVPSAREWIRAARQEMAVWPEGPAHRLMQALVDTVEARCDQLDAAAEKDARENPDQ